MLIAGVDFGSKLAGTTAIAYLENGMYCIHQSQKGQNTDEWILEMYLSRT
ncbi:MAG: hypothetical protein IPN89_07345 [Saprospiraceae bacterium]|nr:hypothetical protein [Saprospiraceae bacterium]MBL0101068.1 hypothetical protein [Saprospiraceae bacterium]